MRGSNSNPHPTEDPTAPLIQAGPSILTPDRGGFDAEDPAWPSPPPSTTNSQYADKPHFSRLKPPRSKPLFRNFERPSLFHIAILAILCLIIYPAFYILTLVAKDKSLFIVRLLVSTWCSGIGFGLGYILLRIAAQHLEAASEFMSIEYRDFLRPDSKSLGHCDSHEPRGWWNETPRSDQKHE